MAESDRCRMEVMRQWAVAHAPICGCDDPDEAGCSWPVPVPHTMAELCDALAVLEEEVDWRTTPRAHTTAYGSAA